MVHCWINDVIQLVTILTLGRILSKSPGKARVPVSLKKTVEQLALSSNIPVSHKEVKEVISIVSTSVPWFCRIIKLNGEGCMSSPSTTEDIVTPHRGNELQNGRQENQKLIYRGKENGGFNQLGKEVEGLLIFAKKDGKFIGREDVLKEFRQKRSQWEQSI
jgi:hypothetical protein